MFLFRKDEHVVLVSFLGSQDDLDGSVRFLHYEGKSEVFTSEERDRVL